MKRILLFLGILISSVTGFSQINEADRSVALDLVRKNNSAIGVSPLDVENSIVGSTYIVPGSEVRMVYLQQSHLGIPVYNQLHVLAFKNEKPVSVAGQRINDITAKVNGDATPGIDPTRAVRTALKNVNAETNELIVPVNILNEGRRFEFGSLGVSSENIFAELLWFPLENGSSVKLVWQVFAAPLNSSAYWMIRVDAKTGRVINKENMTISCGWGPEDAFHKHTPTEKAPTPVIENFVAKRKETPAQTPQNDLVNTATYRVIKYPAESPIHPGGAPSLHTDPWLMTPGNATTLGWHDDGAVTYDSTRGNNVFAYDDRDANNLPGRSGVSTVPLPNIMMDFVPDFSLEPVVRTPAPNQQFNTTNLFYWNNLIHDLAYIYGFTESARNYQNSNLGRGGAQGDYVLAEAQDGSGTNNANFSSGTDGTRGRMQMYLWTAPNPDRDGDVDNGIIAHEYTHGTSNRMTGTGSGCLNVQEQMGEGWSDYFGLMITHNWAAAAPADGFNSPRGIGTYALNQPITGVGIRQYRYTTNMAVNPMTYANLPNVAVPHGVGTIWCTALWDMTWYIIQQAGINPNIYNPSVTGGNSIALKLVIEGLRLQPCNPGFISGRDAILRADTIFFGAQYSCAIWEAFARRGMGVGASQGSSNVRGDETITFDAGKPTITTQPQNVSVCLGSNHIFSVSATGLDLHFQWQLSTNGGTSFNDISGATSNIYSVTGVTAGMNSYQYRCVVTGCPLPVTSNAAILTVTTPPVLTGQPTAVTVCEGSNTSFSVTATGAGTLYQWQVSTNGGSSFSNIAGATNATLNLTAVTAAMNNNQYRCQVSNAGCTTPINSTAVVLTVNAQTAITAQPANVTICAGTNTTLCVTAVGVNLTYQWEASVNCSGTWTNVTGATAACLVLTNPATTMSYRCRVSGLCGSAVTSNCVIVTVINPVTISSQPANAELCAGGNTSFSVTASSNQTISYQWQVSTAGGQFTDINGATTSTYTVNNVTTALSGNQYRVQMTNAACSTPVSSAAATLTVRQVPTITLSATPFTSLLPGQVSRILAETSPATAGTISTIWFLNNNQVPNTGNPRIVNVEQLGTYQVRVQETFPSGLVCSALSETIVIDAKVSPKLFIFPSPNDGRFTVSYYNNGGSNTQRRILIYDAKGAKVYDKQFNITGPYTLMNIDLHGAGRGIYIVAVGDAAGNKLVEGKVHVR